MATGGSRKCANTGHFFVCNPQHSIPFSCFECHQRFTPFKYSNSYSSSIYWVRSSRSDVHGHSRSSSSTSQKDCSTTSETESSSNDSSLPISKPWRCLVEKCLMLACDRCSDRLTEQTDGVPERHPRNSESRSHVADDKVQNPRISTPVNRPSTQEGPLVLENDDKMDSPKLIYRRAGCAADDATAHYHRRAPRKINRSTLISTVKPDERLKPETDLPAFRALSSELPQVDDDDDNNENDDENEEAWIAAQRSLVRSAKQAGQRAVRKAYLRQMSARNSLQDAG